ncbi:MAG: NACHT domain-containing protein [Pseudomonadota bacterium]
MTGKTESASLADAGLGIFNILWGWSGTSEGWRFVFVVMLLIILLVFASAMFLSALGKVLEGLAKLIDVLKTSRLPRFMTREDRMKVRHRSQFCAVLEADLTNIAKAESWNDQYFTDLEAEVETEGGYYISSLHRWLGKVSTGLRKEKSLIKAISSSSERAIQLTGEPGSGKSVALRHLASQLAVRAKTSKTKDILVPLYINLREINVTSSCPITADTIRDFILDNIRRGDSDTTDYVRGNWTDYRQRGIWFFLFDSFDEIPAVLHAEKGSPAVNEYSQAIRMFLEGMGECRGILASREFKGPESLPWKKFRILRLTSGKQHELVANAFLSQVQERAVLHHLATNESTLANTPLFMTLLCRYVKESSSAPTNDYELLSLQIDRLAHRDPTYLKRTYGLSPAELLGGAQRIARLFAEEPSLGLAPTIDQVEAVLNRADMPGGDIQRFIAAMVDSKIARADVANAILGDRRFAFSHRRYQEALFVRHLVANPGYLSGYDLLTDPRWREYAVTLLETQPVEALKEMFNAASQVIVKASATQRRWEALDPLDKYCGYFEWNCEVTQMLTLLHEGLVRRVAIIPEALSVQVEKFLHVRWETGDSFDRVRVMRVASLLPQATLCRYLEEVFTSGSEKAQNEGFNQTASLIGDIPAAVRRAVLTRLADEILSARDAPSLLRVEALIARLPHSLGAEYVQRRCILLWKYTKAMRTLAVLAWPDIVTDWLRALLNPRRKSVATARTNGALLIGAMIALNAPLLSALLLNKFGMVEVFRDMQVLFFATSTDLSTPINKLDLPVQAKVISSCFLLVPLIYAIFPFLFHFRAEGEPINLKFFLRQFGSIKAITVALKFFIVMLAAVVGLGALIYLLGELISFVASHMFGFIFPVSDVMLGFATLLILSTCLITTVELLSIRRKREVLRMFNAQFADKTSSPFRIVLSSRNWQHFKYWLFLWDECSQREVATGNFDEQLRSISAVLQYVQRGGILPKTVVMFMNENPSPQLLTNCISDVERMKDN